MFREKAEFNSPQCDGSAQTVDFVKINLLWNPVKILLGRESVKVWIVSCAAAYINLLCKSRYISDICIYLVYYVTRRVSVNRIYNLCGAYAMWYCIIAFRVCDIELIIVLFCVSILKMYRFCYNWIEIECRSAYRWKSFEFCVDEKRYWMP